MSTDGDDLAFDSNWFGEAAEQSAASLSEAEKFDAQKRKLVQERLRRGMDTPTKTHTAAELRDALKAFGVAADAGVTATGGLASTFRTTQDQLNVYRKEKPGSRFPKPITPDEGLDAIVGYILQQPDPYKAAGEWLTKATQKITGAVAFLEPED